RLEAVIKIGIVVMDPKSYLALVEDRDTPLLLQALHRAGVSAEAFSWHDREVDWSQLDLAVLRTPWDYSSSPRPSTPGWSMPRPAPGCSISRSWCAGTWTSTISMSSRQPGSPSCPPRSTTRKTPC